jgi:hypothetical protein
VRMARGAGAFMPSVSRVSLAPSNGLTRRGSGRRLRDARVHDCRDRKPSHDFIWNNKPIIMYNYVVTSALCFPSGTVTIGFSGAALKKCNIFIEAGTDSELNLTVVGIRKKSLETEYLYSQAALPEKCVSAPLNGRSRASATE